MNTSKKPKRGWSLMIWLSITVVVLAICNVLIVVLFIENPFQTKGRSPRLPTPTALPTSTPTPGHPSIGQEGILHVDRGPSTHPVAIDQDTLKELFRAIDAKDDYGIRELLQTGRLLPVQDGTKILVIDEGLYTIKIRILEGPYTGRSGWVPHEWITIK